RGARSVVVVRHVDASSVELYDLAAQREPDAGAGVLVTAVQALEDHEDAVPVLLGDADAVVADADLPVALAVVRHAHADHRRLLPRNLMPLPTRFWNRATSRARSPATAGS